MKLITATRISVISLAALFSVSADADSFRGILDDKGRPVPVILTLRSDAAPGANAGHIRFDGPWACAFNLQIAQGVAQRRTYFLTGAGAGRCSVLTSGYLHTQPENEGLAIRLSDRKNRAPALYRLTVQPTDS
jgi:hypothetical protein